MERVETGIPGLDPLIDGGIPKGFNALVVGRPGTGKTIFGLQYIYNGILDGENGLYVTLDAKGELIRAQGNSFGWEIEKLEEDKKLCILDVPLNRQLRLNLFRLIENKVKEYNVKRIVFDSLPSFLFNINQFNIQLPNIDNLSAISRDSATYFEEDVIYKQSSMGDLDSIRPDPVHYPANTKKRIIYLMFREFSTLGTTNIIITSSSPKSQDSTVDGVSEYICDGVFDLKALSIGETLSRTISVRKMRHTKVDGGIKSYDITPKGLALIKE